jgi:tetratricopeptide (TPR) repeat protein
MTNLSDTTDESTTLSTDSSAPSILMPSFRSIWKRLGSVFILLTAAMVFSNSAAVGQQDRLQPPRRATIHGVVRDSAGKPVGHASVRLEQDGVPGAAETKTDADGAFAFANLVVGGYSLVAELSGRRSSRSAVIASSSSDHQPVTLTLEIPDRIQNRIPAGSQSSSEAAAPTMEFADAPNFTVAAVTDWTAAGGHGSDSSLRTSESLTREALTLKPQGAGAGDAGGNSSAMRDSERTLREELAKAPRSFEANRRLGEFYLHGGRYPESIGPLQTAYRLDPKNEPNEYDLALALKGNGDFAQAREHIGRLMAHGETANLHRVAGELDEKLGDPLTAVHELEQAVRKDPSEENYFEWGSELLLHRAVLQAKDVFAAGAKAYPKSARMLTALGAALFAGAFYDESALRLCDASDLNPADPEPYMFMGKIEIAAPNPLACVEQKLARFVEQQPANPLANYYYAMTIWKHHGQSTDATALRKVETMLTKAVTFDPQCGVAYLQLGVLKASQRDYPKAIEFYSKAIATNPELSEAHYRLGVAYDRVGDRAKAKQEFQLHDEIEKKQAATVERQRREVKQFLVVVPDKPADH